MNKKLLIIDGNSLINRAFYALPYLTNSKGQFTGAVFGFTNMLVKVLAAENPTHVVVAFDHARKTFRNELYAEYKGTRKATPPELISQLNLLKEVLDKMNIVRVQQEGIEADDIIGTISKSFEGQVVILSGDKDVFQLVSDNISVMMTKKGISETEIVTPNNMKELYGYTPDQVIFVKSLMGDASDNIPGVSGVGPKTAIKLLEDFGTLDNIYANIESQKGTLKEKLIENKENAYISKELATIKTDCNLEGFDIEKAKLIFPFSAEVATMFKELEFSSLLARKDLFAGAVIIENKPSKKNETVSSVEVLKQKIKNAQNESVFAFNLCTKPSIAFKNEAYNLNFELNLFNEGLKIEDVLNQLKTIFEDEKIVKVTSNLKDHLHLFNKHNVVLKGEIFDNSIAEYLINAGIKSGTQNQNASEIYDSYPVNLQALKDLDIYSLYTDIELPLCFVLCNMEKDGFKIDSDELEKLSVKYNEELENLTKQIHALSGQEFNVNSPKQVAEVLFDKLNLKAWGNKKNSTNIDVLTELYDQHEVVPLIVRYRKLFKLNSSYIESYKQIVKEKGEIIHTVFNQTLTSTGRLSSSEPNLQNIPVRDDEGKALRKLFISRFENGNVISADYNQIELRLLASFSGDKNMVEAYKNNKDIHALTASQIFKVDISDVTPNMRRAAKAVNFGIVYGISDYGLSLSIGSSVKRAKDYIESYFETYKDVKTYMDKNIEQAKQTGMVRTLFKRFRKVPEINSSRFQLRQFGERVAMNMPLQGSASDIIKLAMIKIFKALQEENMQSKLILQVHDELIVDTFPGEEEKVICILKDCMENVVSLSVPLPVAISSGKTWFDCK